MPFTIEKKNDSFREARHHLTEKSSSAICHNLQKKNKDLRQITGKLTVANDAFKKNVKSKQKMTIVKSLAAKLSLEKSLLLAGVSKIVRYSSKRPKKKYSTKPCDISDNPKGWEGGISRPTFETRKMVASASRKLKTTVNRKQIRRISHKPGWIEPAKTKSEIIKSKRQLFKPIVPNYCGRQT